MMKSRYLPYDFNEKYEYMTYKNIGVQHRIEYFAMKNIWYKWRLKIRNLRNRKENRYRNINTYTEWCEYVKRNNEGNINTVNKMRFLNARRRSNEVLAQSAQSIATPIYVCIITMQVSVYVGYGVDGIVTIIVSTILCMMVLLVLLDDMK